MFFGIAKPEHAMRYTRRQLIGTAIAGSAIGGLIFQSSKTATASVRMGVLDIEGEEVKTDSGQVKAVSVNLSGEWDYALQHGKPRKWTVTLLVGKDDTWSVVGTDSGSVSYYRYGGEYSISGSITNTKLYTKENFSVDERGKTKEIDLPLKVRFELLGNGTRVLASAEVAETAKIKITRKAFDASLYGDVGGTGEVEIETESG